jgi:hypothetical protein
MLPNTPMHFMDYEDLKHRPQTTIASILQFLNTSDAQTQSERLRNATTERLEVGRGHVKLNTWRGLLHWVGLSH